MDWRANYGIPSFCEHLSRNGADSMEDAAKLHTLARLRGAKTGAAPSMSNQAGAILHVFLGDVKALPESIAWTEGRRQKARAVRAKSDARTKAGAWRKEGWQEVDARRQARLVAC